MNAYNDAAAAGGLDAVKEKYNRHNRHLRQKKKRQNNGGPKPNEDLAEAHAASIHGRILKQRAAIKEKESHPKGQLPDEIRPDRFVDCKSLHYCKSKNTVEVNGARVKLQNNPITAKRRGPTRTKTVRPQLTQELVSTLNSPVIDERSGEVTKIEFPNGMENVVIQCRRGSSDSALRDFHHFMVDGEGRMLNDLLDKLPNSCWKEDSLGGGRYHPVGHSTRGTPKGMPSWGAFLRATAKNEHSMMISRLLGKAFSLIARILSKHCPKILAENDKFWKMNSNAAWPTYAMQDFMWRFFCTQTFIRRWGGPKYAQTREEALTSLHLDEGDIDTLMPLFYMSGGGVDGLGGPVEDTNVQIFAEETGGASVTVKTCTRDTIVIVLMNSRRQLHGVVRSSPDFRSDGACWTTRFIPVFSEGVMHSIRKYGPSKKPWRYPENRNMPWESQQYCLPWRVPGIEE